MAFAARMQTKKQKTITKSLPTTECAMEVGRVEMTTFSSSTTTTPTAATSSSSSASAMVASPVTSSSSSSKRQRSSNDGDGAGGAGGGSYHHETLLPPNKAATESSGIATLDCMVEHLVEALKQQLEVPFATGLAWSNFAWPRPGRPSLSVTFGLFLSAPAYFWW